VFVLSSLTNGSVEHNENNVLIYFNMMKSRPTQDPTLEAGANYIANVNKLIRFYYAMFIESAIITKSECRFNKHTMLIESAYCCKTVYRFK